MMGPQQEDYIETVFTCEGDYDDPHLQDRLEDFQKSLKDLLLTDKNKLILKKVEPWNSVRVTFNIPREAAVRLKQLAQQRNETLRELGVLAVQIQNQHISLTIAGRNNERTQLVFRTAETTAVTTPSVSVFETNSPSLDQLGPQGPGPSNIEATSKKISDYLRQNSAIIGTLLHNQPQHDKAYPTSTAVDVGKGKVNNIYAPFSEHGATFQHTQPHPSHNMPSSSSPTGNAPSPSRSPLLGQKVATSVSGMPPGLPPGLPPTGPRHPGLDNLPPPPPYPQGSSFMNNIQKLRFGTPGASPLLVNLLQNDPNLSNFLAAGRIPGAAMDTDSLPPPVKKKRKPPKKKKNAEGTVPIKSSVQNPALSPGHSGDSFPVTALPSSTSTTTSFVNHGVTPSVREHAFLNPQAMHNTNMQVPSEHSVPLTSPLVQRKSDESDTAGKIINPVTGVLEPMEIASDISPAKSDSSTGKQHSPRSLSQKVNTKVETIGNLSIKKDKSVEGGHQGKPENQSISLQPSDLASIHRLPRRHQDNEFSNSSQYSLNAPSALSQHQKSIQEVMKNDLLAKAHLKNNIKLEQKMSVPDRLGDLVMESKTCDRLTEMENSTVGSECVAKRDVLPQESEQKSIPCQLLNKPLLQVKHNGNGGKPSSGSPDSNGDSECSTQSINLDTHNGSQADPRAYNNDSGVGSCSERSDDTPSEPGDSDYKSGHTSSFECAKTQVMNIETAKQATPSSKVMTVGYAISDTPKDIKNHQIVSAFPSIERLNSSYDSVKLRSEKLEVCSTSQSQVIDWSQKEQHPSVANNVELLKNAVRDRNTKSPKLSVSLATSLAHNLDGQHHTMQGNSEVSMQKKKSSPRNSPRGSPRNVGSPRHPGSPRGASPRTSDAGTVNQRPSFLTAHDYSGNHPSESQNKSPYSESGRSPHSEQRKSPFSMMLTSHQGTSITNKTNIAGSGGVENLRMDFHHSVGGVGVDALRMASQPCNIDSIALLKALEANPHLSHLSAIAANKDPGLIQKLEELRPLFQKLQQQQYSSPASLVTPVNGIENFNHSARSPLGQPSSLSKPPPGSFVNSAFDNVSLPNNIHPLSVSDRENINVNNHSSKSNKVTIDESKGANGNTCKRGSPGAATSSSASYVQGYDSSLPPPKRLTESVQKLFPLPLDNHLPHDNRRSPSNSASTTRPSASATVSPPSSRTAVTAGLRLSGTDAHSFEVDSITPSFIGFGADIQTGVGKTNCVSIPETVHIPVLPASEPRATQSQGSHQLKTSVLTRSVPVLTGSIPSHRAIDTKSSRSTTHSTVFTGGSSKTVLASVAIPASEVKTVMCNSDSKMASSTIESTTLKAPLSSTVYSSTSVSQSTVRYPVVSAQSEKPKSLYQQMGLSEMLLETARSQVSSNIPSATSISQCVASSQSTASVRTSPKITVPSEQESARKDTPVDTLKTDHNSKAPASSSSSSTLPNSSQSSRTVTLSQGSGIVSSQDIVKPTNSEYSDSDIPKLTRQTNLASVENGPVQPKTQPVSVAKCTESDSKASREVSQTEKETFSKVTINNSNPPVLTAVSDLVETSGSDTTAAVPEVPNAVQSSGTEEKAASLKVPTAGSEGSSKNPSDIPELTKHTGETENSLSGGQPVINNPPSHHVLHNFYHEVDLVDPTSAKTPKVIKKHQGALESADDKSDDSDVLPRQLRSRKRNNTGESDTASAPEDNKRIKLEPSADVVPKVEIPNKDIKASANVKTLSTHNATTVSEHKEEENIPSDSIKSGLRTRTNLKNVNNDDKDPKGKVPVGRDLKKDSRVVSSKSVVEKKVDPVKVDDSKKVPNRRNRQSPSAPLPEKQAAAVVARDKSPLRGRTRGRNSPVVVDGTEESQENKRTTRSAKTKGEPPTAGQGKAVAANKRRRTSQDHR